MQPRDAVIIDIEVLADQLTQQPVRFVDLLVVEKSVGARDGLQRALGVLRDTGQHLLALGPLAPATVRFVSRPRIVELQRAIDPARGRLVDRLDSAKQLAHSVADQPDRVFG